MATIKRVLGAPTLMTITLASLANAAGRVGTQIDFTSASGSGLTNQAVLISYRFRVGSVAPTANSTVQFFWARSVSGVSDGNLAATDTGYTSSSLPFSASQLRDQLQYCYSQPVIATTSLDYRGSFIVFDPGPKGSLYVYNDIGQALDSTGTNFTITYQTIDFDVS